MREFFQVRQNSPFQLHHVCVSLFLHRIDRLFAPDAARAVHHHFFVFGNAGFFHEIRELAEMLDTGVNGIREFPQSSFIGVARINDHRFPGLEHLVPLLRSHVLVRAGGADLVFFDRDNLFFDFHRPPAEDQLAGGTVLENNPRFQFPQPRLPFRDRLAASAHRAVDAFLCQKRQPSHAAAIAKLFQFRLEHGEFFLRERKKGVASGDGNRSGHAGSEYTSKVQKQNDGDNAYNDVSNALQLALYGDGIEDSCYSMRHILFSPFFMKKKILYWLPHVLLLLFMVGSGIMYFVNAEEVAKIFVQLGYPVYTMYFNATAKILGGIAIVWPGCPRFLKEWAYAGYLYIILLAAQATYVVMPEGLWMMGIFIAIFAWAYYEFWKKSKKA